MHTFDPKEVGSAKLKLIEAIDKLAYARGSLMMQKNEYGPKRAGELHSLITALEQLLVML